MPDQSSTRYEEHDHPGFVAEMTKLCPGCKVLYQNADGDASRQQQQFNSVVSQGAKAIVLDPVDSTAAASLVKAGAGPGHQGHRLRPAHPLDAGRLLRVVQQRGDRQVDRQVAGRPPQGGNVAPADVGLLEINGSPTDAAAGLIKKGIHEGLADGGYATLAEYDTPEWAPSKAQQWASGQISRFNKKIVGVVAANDGTGGGAIAAFKAAGVDPVPPVTGNDATIAGLQLIIAGDQYNTISKPSEVVAAAAADVAVRAAQRRRAQGRHHAVRHADEAVHPGARHGRQPQGRDRRQGRSTASRSSSAAVLCTGRYAEGCKKLGITP